MKNFLFLLYSKFIVKKEYQLHKNASEVQEKFLLNLVSKNQNSKYGIKFNFKNIHSQSDYKKNIPLIHYEEILEEIEKIKSGEQGILTHKKIKYLLQTSGTSAGTKYIPISKSGIRHQINAAMKLLCFYAVEKGSSDFISHKMLFLQGSPKLDYSLKIPSGRLSGIVYHYVPALFNHNKLPSYQTNIIENWQEKINQMANESLDKDISVFGGIPPWCLQFFELICKKKNTDHLRNIFPNLGLYIYGGVDFTSYKLSLEKILSKDVDMMQTFPASEGFFAIQDTIGNEDMLLLLRQGIFYEFIPLENAEEVNPKTLQLSDVELKRNYELVITNDSGLWRYRIGDLIQFSSLCPYRIKVAGRRSQFISAFGEHVIGYEIEQTMNMTIDKFNLKLEDYHVSPNVQEKRYEWRIEWREIPEPIIEIEHQLDTQLSILNKYYNDLIIGKIIKSCRIISVPKDTFHTLRKKINKDGGQNKILRLANTNAYATMIDHII